ncbi:MAG: NDP-sugar synthase [Clostridia bacterium]|nr:NDP-sugar synthase [Clostridia bacterium]
MKAVILAGGRGERLRPITDTRPKPLVPVLARPVMDYCLSLLGHHGVTKAYVTTHYLADQIRHRYGDTAFGIQLSYHKETVPLGTCGGVKELEEHLKEEELFLVMSGDALCDFDLSAAIEFHRKKKAHVTIILSSVKTPLEYGVVLQDTMEKIFAFSEKPDWSETLSDLANTGVYILSPEVLKKVPEGQTFDFARDLFPLLLKEGYSLFGYKDKGYWCDIGKISSLYRCNQDLMQGKAKIYAPPCGSFQKSSDGEGVSFVSDTAVVEKGAYLKEGCVISPGVHLASGSCVSSSVIMENTGIKKGAVVSDALLCEGCKVGEDSVVLSGSVLGAGSVVADTAFSEKGRKYPPGSVITRFPSFLEDGLVFTEEGTALGSRAGLNREEAERLGYALAHLDASEIGIVWDERSHLGAHYAALLASGVVLGGKKAHLFLEGTKEMASFSASYYGIFTVFVSEKEGRGLFFVYGKQGMPLFRREVLKISRFFEEEKKNLGSGSMVFSENLRQLYCKSLSEEMGEGKKMRVGFSGPFSSLLREAAINADFHAYDGTRQKGVCMEIFHDEMKIFLDGQRLSDTEKTRLYVLEQEISKGRRNFVLPKNSPYCFAEHITTRGGKAEYFSLGHTDKDEKAERDFARRDRWLYDNAHLAAKALNHLAGKSGDLIREEFKKLPEIYISTLRYEPKEENKARLLTYANALSEHEKKVRIQSGFYGMKIISEAANFEAALDNAFKYRGKLNEIEEKLRGK